MADTLRIKRRNSGGSGAPSSLMNAELAYNFIDDTLYIGKGDDGSGGATSVIPIGGDGRIDGRVSSAISAAIGTTVQAYDAKLAQIAGLSAPGADRVLFWDESASAYKHLIIGSGLSISDTTLVSTGSGGSVTSVALSLPTGLQTTGSPITTSGTFTVSWSSGYQGYTTSEATKLSGIAAGATANTGTVTSVALSLPSIFSVSGSPVTGSGTLTGSLANQTANKVLASPNGSTGAPTFRALVVADIPTGTSGANVPLLNGANTWSNAQTFSSTVSVTGAITGSSTISDTQGNVRSPGAVTANVNTTLSTTHLNRPIEKKTTTARTYTIASGLGSQGDMIPIVNSASSGDITVAPGSGVTLYKSGVSGSFTVPPYSMATIYRTATSDLWIAP